MAEHSPAPWRPFGDQYGIQDGDGAPVLNLVFPRHLYSEIRPATTSAEAQERLAANRALVCAAPDMYDLLQELAVGMEYSLGDYGYYCGHMVEWKCQIEAMLARAEGQTNV